MYRLYLVVAALVLSLGASPPGDDGPREPTAAAAAPRLSPTNAAALADLAATGPATLDARHLALEAAGHDSWGPAEEPPLAPDTAGRLEAQWNEAVSSTPPVSTPALAEAAGYQRAGSEVPGIGAHYVNWPSVDEPFDPARPAMLLFDESPVRPTRLLGYSYWIRSTEAPEGFVGDADEWHMHHGLCFADGMLRDEGVATASDCRGTWLAGSDLWMLHAWVAPETPNPWGRFAPRHPLGCPGDAEPVADFSRCPSPFPEPTEGGGAGGEALNCSVLAVERTATRDPRRVRVG